MTPNQRLLALLHSGLPSGGEVHPWVIKDARWKVSLTDEERSTFIHICPPRRLSRGEYVYHVGGPAGLLHIVKEGHVKLCVTGAYGQECVLHVLGPGDVFGESFLTDIPYYEADAVCMSDGAVVCVIDQEKFLRLAAHVPAAVLAFTAVLAQHTAELQRRLRDGGRPALARVACTLSDLAQRCGSPDGTGMYLLELKLNHAEIAALANTSRPTVTQAISQFRKRHLVAGTRGTYCIDVAGLQAIATRPI